MRIASAADVSSSADCQLPPVHGKQAEIMQSYWLAASLLQSTHFTIDLQDTRSGQVSHQVTWLGEKIAVLHTHPLGFYTPAARQPAMQCGVWA